MYYDSWRDSCAQAKRQGRARFTAHTLVSKDRLSSEVFRVAKDRVALWAFRLLLLLRAFAGPKRRRGFGRIPLCVCEWVCVCVLVYIPSGRTAEPSVAAPGQTRLKARPSALVSSVFVVREQSGSPHPAFSLACLSVLRNSAVG